jgi:hypothetical protein
MTDQADRPEKPKFKRMWGKRFPQFYAECKGQTVLVGMTTGVVFKGELVGVDTYDFILRLKSGTDVLLHRSNIVYVQRSE